MNKLTNKKKNPYHWCDWQPTHIFLTKQRNRNTLVIQASLFHQRNELNCPVN